MNTGLLLIAVIVVMIIGFAATLMVGFSKQNKNENPAYGQGTKKKWARIGWLYVVCVIIALSVFLYLVNR